MKYTVAIEIDQPIDRVVALFDNPANDPKWMAGLHATEHLSGEPGTPGAKRRLVFKFGDFELKMTETLLARNLPQSHRATYEAGPVYNLAETRFVALSPTRTKYVSEQEFRFKSLKMTINAWLKPKPLKQKTLKYLEAFKQFAENGAA